MNKRNHTRRPQPTKHQKTDAKRWRTYVLMTACSLLLMSGFFYAGRQHFSSMDYGMKNSRLRKQIDELEAEKRRLLRAREVSLSPAEIKKAAKKTGMADMSGVEADVARVDTATKEKAAPTAVADMKPVIIKTASVAAVQTSLAAAYPKPEKIAKQIKKSLSTE